MCALSCILLSLGALIEVLDITSAALASFIVVIAVIELGGYYPFLLYLSTSVLSFLILPNKTVAFIYILFFGFYPILKKHLEKLRPLFSFIAKAVIFNGLIFIYYSFIKQFLLYDTNMAKILLIGSLNVIFFTLDFTLTLFVTAYVRRFRQLLQINRFFK